MLNSLNSDKKLVFKRCRNALVSVSLRIGVLILPLAILPLTTANAAELRTDSTITKVTVYPGSAKITRVSKVDLAAGDNVIIINNLPLSLNESSLRVSGEGEGAIKLGSVELSRDIQTAVVQEKEQQIRDKIEAVQENRALIEDSITRNRSQLEYIQKMVLGSSTSSKRRDEGHNGSYSNLPLDQWQNAWDTLDDATKRVQVKIREANKQLKLSDQTLNKLRRELQQVASNQTERRVAKLQIHTETATQVTLNLNYQINGARWEPVYDADLNTETGSIELKTLAQISQRTGEDWSNVAVTLSTLRPSAGTQLPQLNSWVLDFMPDFPVAESNSFNTMVAKESVQMDAASPKSLPKPMAMARKGSRSKPIRQQQSRLISADFSAEYQVPGAISLDSGSNKRRFALNSQKIESQLKLASSPRFDPRVMILATSKYQDETPLLAGSMSLYRKGNFVGNTYLSQKLSGEEIKLSFGEDDKVKIKFLPNPDKKRKDGLLFGKKKVVERHYKINVTSNHTKPFSISIYDVLPVASDESIKIKSLGTLPSQTDVDDKEGVVGWDKTLTPKTDIEIKYGYSVSYPEDKQVLGL